MEPFVNHFELIDVDNDTKETKDIAKFVVSQIGINKKYKLEQHNCEHFVKYIINGEVVSDQEDFGKEIDSVYRVIHND